MKPKHSIVLLMLLLGGIYWQWWLPGPRVATDFSLVSQASLRSQMDFPQTWSVKGTEGLGEYTVFTLWSWPFNFLYGVLANLGLSFAVLQRVLIVLPFLVFGSLGIWKLCAKINLSNPARLISVLFYLTNTYILLLIDGGQLSISLIYALFPLGFLAVEEAVYGNLKKKVLAGLLTFIMGIFDIRFIYIFFILMIIRFLYEFLFLSPKKWVGWIVAWLKTGLVISIIFLGLNAYWLIVIIKYPLSPSLYSSLTKSSFTSFISFPHALMLLSPHWFRNVFGYLIPTRFEFLFIPVLVFLAPVLKSKNRIIGFWLLVAVVSIFLTKGSSEPLPQIYQWLYYNMPGFSLFRDSSKFFFLLALGYTVLIGVTIDEIIKRVHSFKIKTAFIPLIGTNLFIFTLVVYFVFLIRPVWLGKMTGTFSPPQLQKEYSKLNNFIPTDQTESNVFWIPTISPLTSLDTRHPAVEAARLAQKRPFAQANLGTYELFNFLREALYMGELFDVASLGYIVYPPLDQRRDNPHPDNTKYYYTFLNQLSNLPWLSRIENLPIPLLKVRKHQDKLFIVPNTWWVIGSDSIYNEDEATKSSQLKLSKNALIFVEEYPVLGVRIDDYPSAKIVLNNKTTLDLAASLIKSEHMIFPARGLDFEPNKSGWWKREATDLIRWREFLQTKYGIDNQDFDLGGGWAVGEGNRQLTMDNGQLKSGNILLARVLESTRSGELGFHQDGQLVGRIDTKKEGNNVRWFEVGQLTEDGGELEITSSGDINVVNALAVLDKNEWVNYKDKAKKLQERVVNFDEKNAQSDNNPKVTYQKIHSTKYIVNVNGLTQPAFLVFSQNYDGLWKLDGQIPLPVYSLLNGFKIEKNGQYILEFEAQKYVYPGLVISLTTLVLIIYLLLIHKNKQSSI